MKNFSRDYDEEINMFIEYNDELDYEFPTISDDELELDIDTKSDNTVNSETKKPIPYYQTIRVLELLEFIFNKSRTLKEIVQLYKSVGFDVSSETLKRDIGFLLNSSYIDTYVIDETSVTQLYSSDAKEENDSFITTELLNKDNNTQVPSGKLTTYYYFKDIEFHSPNLKLTEEDYRVFKALKDSNNTFIDKTFIDKVECLQRKISRLSENQTKLSEINKVYYDKENDKLALFKEIWNYVPGLYDYKTNSNLVFELLKAISKQYLLKVNYQKAEEDNIRSLQAVPVSFYIFDGTLYLILYSIEHQNFFALTVHFIDSIEVKNNRYHNIPNLELNQFLKNRFGVYEEKPVSVKLRIKKQYRRYFENRKWHPSQTSRKINTGDLIIQMEVPLTPEFVAWIIKWTDAITVVEPHELIVKVKEGARRILANYEK